MWHGRMPTGSRANVSKLDDVRKIHRAGEILRNRHEPVKIHGASKATAPSARQGTRAGVYFTRGRNTPASESPPQTYA